MSVGFLVPSAQEMVGEPATANILELRRGSFEWEAPKARVSKPPALGSGLLVKSDAQVVEDVQESELPSGTKGFQNITRKS
eukprot:10079302-Alexandrium_andersonii.AAC.1